jgi:hypothetical protein
VDYGAKKLATCTVLDTFCTLIFLIIFSTSFFLSMIPRLKDKKLLLFKFFISDAAVSNEILKKLLWTIKYSLEQKCE